MGKRLLIVVDMQKDFIDGSLGTAEAKAIVPRVASRVREYTEAGDEVVFTMDTHFQDYLDTLEGKKLPVSHCQKGTSGWELCGELAGIVGRRFEKGTFGSLECMEYAAKGAYASVELIGLCTDICVISNAMLIKAAMPQTTVQVRKDCCAGVTRESHENALKAMAMCQIDIV